MGKPISKVARVRVSGPLARFAAGFNCSLLEAGYTPLTAVTQLRLMAHVSRWLDRQELTAADLTDERVEAYLAARRAEGRRWLFTRRGVAPLLEFLASQHALPAEMPAAPESAVHGLLDRFEQYLLSERGLATSTTSAYVSRAGRFLAGYAADGNVAAVTAADIIRAVREEGVGRSVGAVQYFVAAIRAFLRFCHLEGLIGEDLSGAAQTATGRRASLLPRGLNDRDAARLLGSCDRRTAIGRRDYAVMLLMLRLGLRAGEVAALRLHDVDWRAGEIEIRGKGRREERLPLPVNVGEAIVSYLRRGRPATTRREVFVTTIAPIRELTREAVSDIIRRACRRAGLPEVGAHRLRHTTACVMVGHGVPLSEIGQVLRHLSPTATANYARVDVGQLQALARPWPGRGGQQR